MNGTLDASSEFIYVECVREFYWQVKMNGFRKVSHKEKNVGLCTKYSASVKRSDRTSMMIRGYDVLFIVLLGVGFFNYVVCGFIMTIEILF